MSLHTHTGDIEHDLAAAAARRAQIERELHALVESARTAGTTWDVIGACLGVTKQAARKKYGPKTGSTAGDPLQLELLED